MRNARRTIEPFAAGTTRSRDDEKFRASHARPRAEEATEHLDEFEALATTAAAVDGLLERLVRDLSDQDGKLLQFLALGASLDDVAAKFDITYSTAGVRVHRLKDKIKQLLERYG